MPFKLRLKKSRQYNVVSKNLFVISVELLDNTIVECTLSADSTGLDCLYNVCQRLGLHQPEFFGLRYVSKQEKSQWIDLQKPLKKQLDKHAQEPNLYLGVMFYVADVQQLQDEMTRYQYFLQLKTDIIEGRLLCSQEQAVQLASYSLQAEFGDHDPERHTVEYLKGFVLLPKHMTNNETQLEALTEEVVHTHHTLHSLSPAAAEIYYIILVQRLEGYGQEIFTAKDDSGSELYIGVSLIGIVIKLITGQQLDCFKWNDITNLTFHKRLFGIECEKNNKSMQLHMEDAESAKYIWKISVQQHQFFMKNKIETIPANIDSPVEAAQTSFMDIPHSSSQQSIHDSKSNLEVSVTQHDAPNSVESINIIHHPEIHFEDHSNNFPANGPYTAVVHGDSMFSVNSLGQPNVNFTQNMQSSSSLSLLSSQSSSQQLRALLPSYRPAPDYETAIQHKYGNPGSFIGNLGSSHVYSQQDGLAFSQPEIRQQQHAAQVKSYSHYKNFIDLANLDAVSYGSSYTNCALGNDILPHRAVDRMSVMPNLMLPPTHTYSTPELTTQGIVPSESHLSSDLSALHYQCKPPPPYPYNQRSSASTPDLACQTLQNNRHSSSSPDLVSRKNLGINQGTIDEDLTTNKENVAYINQQIIHNSNVFSLQNTLHSPQVKITRVNSLVGDGNYVGVHKHSVGFVAVPPSPVKAEFVTTNISISHASSNFTGNRSRTSSTQSAPEIITTATYETNSPNSNMIPSTISEQYKNGISNQAAAAAASKCSSSGVSNCAAVPDENKHQHFEKKKDAMKENHNLGPMMLAAMNGLTLSRPDLIARQNSETSVPKDTRCQFLESRMKEGLVFIEFEQVPKKRINADYSTALLPDNAARNRFKDVLPYEDNRVRLAPVKENKTGYINASHISVTVSQQQRFYIAAQGPLANTATSFWQMIWEQHVMLIVMLTEIQEHGRDKCFPYWPQENIKQEFGEYLVACKFSNKSESYITSALVLNHIPSKKQRSVWHIQYTGWPDHGCPEDLPGFLRFMEEIDSVRRHAAIEIPKGRSRNTPIVVHCSAGVGRSGVTILTDIMLYCLDHNENIDVPKMLALLRQQRMLIVQTVAQYKFIYSVLIQYLKNSRLI